jgi:hypothetical protein
LSLLFSWPLGEPSEVSIIHLIAVDATGRAQSAQDYVSDLAHQKARSVRMEDGTFLQRDLVRDATVVDYGGKHFFRAEFKQTVHGDATYVGSIYTKFRGYFLGEDFVARTPEEPDKIADTLRGISFREDERDSRCVEDPIHPGVIRVSERVSQRLLATKIDPKYPEDGNTDYSTFPIAHAMSRDCFSELPGNGRLPCSPCLGYGRDSSSSRPDSSSREPLKNSAIHRGRG